jgi:REP element-mobilizing transposase RayT
VVERSDTTGYHPQKAPTLKGWQPRLMGSTFLSLHYHLVFSTKLREPIIHARWLLRQHEYLGGTVNGLGGHAETVGGTADHVHLLVEMRATHAVADFMRELKKASSIWVHEEIGLRSVVWQEGDAAFTVSAPGRGKVLAYIQNQEEHHRQRSYVEELRILLQRSGVSFEEKYLE